jgi:energy-coupling factor transporter ATP-binding protein EcfA2
MNRLQEGITIVIVTHNMQQATRVAEYTAFMNMNSETLAGQNFVAGPRVRLDAGGDLRQCSTASWLRLSWFS